MRTRIFIFLIILVGMTTLCFAQANGDYQTNAATMNWSTASSWQKYNNGWATATESPTASTAGVITIRNGHSVTVTLSVTVDQLTIASGGALTVNSNRILTLTGNTTVTGTGSLSTGSGTINLGSNLVTGSGSFTVATGGKIVTANTNGITASSSSGAIQCTTRSFSQRGKYEYNGSSAQVTGDGLPTPVQYIIVSGTGGLTLSQSTAIGIEFYTGSIIIDTGSTLHLTQTGVNLSLPYGQMTINGTLNIGSANLVTGVGTFTLNEEGILKTANPNGVSKDAASGSIQCDVRNYYNLSSYTFDGTTAQVTGDAMPTDTEQVHDLTIDNTAGVTLEQDVFIDGTLFILNGEFDRDGFIADFDGYYSPTVNHLEIAEDDEILVNSTVLMEIVPANWTERVERQWTINTTENFSDKNTTFYWTAADDHNFDWTDKTPALFDGETELGSDAYDVSGDPRMINLTFYGSYPTGPITIGLSGGGTLPVELSSFTATSMMTGFVRIDWTTQSETGVAGFYIFRNSIENASSAVLISPMIGATNTSQETSYSFLDREIPGAGRYYYWLQNQDINDGIAMHGPITVNVQNNGNDTPDIPLSTQLNAPYPNPFNPVLNVSFDMAKADNVKIYIYNTKGQKIRTLLDAPKNPGYHRILWDGKTDNGVSVTTGMYYVKMVSGSFKSTHKVMMMK